MPIGSIPFPPPAATYLEFCARCKHSKRLHLWNMSDHPRSKNWTLRGCWYL